jgi:hypothetical protein
MTQSKYYENAKHNFIDQYGPLPMDMNKIEKYMKMFIEFQNHQPKHQMLTD